jgi:hypothetical protein
MTDITINNLGEELHIPTLQRAIEALKGTGQHGLLRQPYERHPSDVWTYYDTHPMDVLKALIPPPPAPPKSEAEKLVDEWINEQNANPEWRGAYVAVAQFVLDKTQPVITPAAAPTTSEKQYVFGPWIEWKGGGCPLPADWEIQTVLNDETMDNFDDCVDAAGAYGSSAWLNSAPLPITHYRVRFEVGKWYNWTGGECPVPEGCLVAVHLRNFHQPEDRHAKAAYFRWLHAVPQPNAVYDPEYDIIRFRVEG